MGTEEIQLMLRLLETANKKHDGTLMILKSAANWRISFSMPNSKEDVQALPPSRTFAEAAHNALALEAKLD